MIYTSIFKKFKTFRFPRNLWYRYSGDHSWRNNAFRGVSLIVGVDDYSSESDVIIIPSALDFVSQDEMLTPLGRLDKYAASENVFNRYVHIRFIVEVEGLLH